MQMDFEATWQLLVCSVLNLPFSVCYIFPVKYIRSMYKCIEIYTKIVAFSFYLNSERPFLKYLQYWVKVTMSLKTPILISVLLFPP